MGDEVVEVINPVSLREMLIPKANPTDLADAVSIMQFKQGRTSSLENMILETALSQATEMLKVPHSLVTATSVLLARGLVDRTLFRKAQPLNPGTQLFVSNLGRTGLLDSKESILASVVRWGRMSADETEALSAKLGEVDARKARDAVMETLHRQKKLGDNEHIFEISSANAATSINPYQPCLVFATNGGELHGTITLPRSNGEYGTVPKEMARNYQQRIIALGKRLAEAA
jgi:hypothetical protein